MSVEAIRVRPARDGERRKLAILFAAVADERDGIAAEPPIDIERRAASWDLDRTLVALAMDDVVGVIFVIESGLGLGEIGMMVAADWRGRGVGTALVAAAIEWARARDLHKLTLSVFPHNGAAIALYRKFSFVEEGRLTKQSAAPMANSGISSRWGCCSSRVANLRLEMLKARDARGGTRF